MRSPSQIWTAARFSRLRRRTRSGTTPPVSWGRGIAEKKKSCPVEFSTFDFLSVSLSLGLLPCHIPCFSSFSSCFFRSSLRGGGGLLSSCPHFLLGIRLLAPSAPGRLSIQGELPILYCFRILLSSRASDWNASSSSSSVGSAYFSFVTTAKVRLSCARKSTTESMYGCFVSRERDFAKASVKGDDKSDSESHRSVVRGSGFERDVHQKSRAFLVLWKINVFFWRCILFSTTRLGTCFTSAARQ